jgi:EAL domain-containing protein (putative c-di-GMP-specific phosphodiesterase class I)
MTTTAEGVETVEQVARLDTIGCDLAQGYFFSEPLPAEKVRALLHSKRAFMDAAA